MALRHVVMLVVVFVCIDAISALSIHKRAFASDTPANGSVEEPETCQGRTPCGWAVYTKVTRYIDYFMKNKCECSKERRCLRDDDDISITAYVYRCKIDDSSKSTS